MILSTESFIKNEPISQYASNAAERVACHHKESSLTFRIVASRVLSCPLLPSSRLNPTCCSQHLQRESQNGITSAKSVLRPWVRAHQFCGHSATCSTDPLRWFQQLQDTGCLCKGKSPPLALMLSVLLVVVTLRGSHTCVLVLLTVREM
jgi:hypothetical protein